MRHSSRYGVVVMEIVSGRWIWSEVLELVDFVPKGKRHSTMTLRFRRLSDNTHAGAVKLIAKELATYPERYTA